MTSILHTSALGRQQEMGLPCIGVQHHHAHIASCMAEHRLEGPVIGVAFDGTGYGTDGAIWGGEVIVCDAADFERRYHLRYVPLAGGDAGAREPWRPALAYLADAGLDLCAAPALERVNERRLRIVRQMIAGGVQTVPTSSCGRLFDAVSAILDICFENRYEAEAAMELEAAACSAAPDLGSFGFDLSHDEIDLRQTFRDITTAVRNREPIPAISAKFHSTLARAIDAACRAVRAADGIRIVCLSGGSFQNMRLLEETSAVLESSGFEVFFPLEIPSNDGGLSLGQAVIANARIGKRLIMRRVIESARGNRRASLHAAQKFLPAARLVPEPGDAGRRAAWRSASMPARIGCAVRLRSGLQSREDDSRRRLETDARRSLP